MWASCQLGLNDGKRPGSRWSESSISCPPMPVSFLFLVKEDSKLLFPSLKRSYDMEGLSVKGQRWPLSQEMLRSRSMCFMEAAGAMLVWVQNEPCNAQ